MNRPLRAAKTADVVFNALTCRSPDFRFDSLSRDERPGGSGHPFGWVISPVGDLSGPLRAGLRFLRHPLPAPPTASLAVHLPGLGRDTGFPRSVRVSRTGQVLSFPRRSSCRRAPNPERSIQTAYRWVQATSRLGLSVITRFIDSSLEVTFRLSRAPHPPAAGRILLFPHGQRDPKGWLHCPVRLARSSYPDRTAP